MPALTKTPHGHSKDEIKRVKWLWPGYIPLGMVSLIQGDGGIGKSTLALSIAATVTLGTKGTWFDGTNNLNPPAGVLHLTWEDPLAEAILPRFFVCGGNGDLFDSISHIGSDSTNDPISLTNQDHLATLSSFIYNSFPVKIKLLIVDTITDFIPGSDTHKNDVIRHIFSNLNKFAKVHDISILIINHLRKDKTNAADAGMASKGIFNSSRSVFLFYEKKALCGLGDGESGQKPLILGHVKNNFGPRNKGFMFERLMEVVGNDKEGDIYSVRLHAIGPYMGDTDRDFEEMASNSSQAKLSFRDKLEAVLSLMTGRSWIPKQELFIECDESISECGERTVTRILDTLVERGTVEKEKKGLGMRYRLTPDNFGNAGIFGEENRNE